MPHSYPSLSPNAEKRIKKPFTTLWNEVWVEENDPDIAETGNVMLGTMFSALRAFKYLPAEEQIRIFSLADWAFRWGYAFGKKTEEFTKMVSSVKDDWADVKEPEWYPKLLK